MFWCFVPVASLVACFAQENRPKMGAGLPDVDAILADSSDMVHSFARNTSEMQYQVAQYQEESHFYLSQQKKAFETMLARQENQSGAIAEHIHQLERGNQRLRDANADLQANITEVQGNNDKLRMAMKALGDKMVTAKMFVQESSRLTDDSDADALKVLRATTRPPTVDSFLAATFEHNPAAFLQLPEPPTGFPDALADGLSAIRSAEEKAAASLREFFETTYNKGYKEQAARNATLAQLLGDRSLLLAHNARLSAAKTKLELTGHALRRRMNLLGSFSQNLDAFTDLSLRGGDAAPPAANATNISILVNDTPATLLRSGSPLRRPTLGASAQDWFIRAVGTGFR